jgi:hypothetical protein
VERALIRRIHNPRNFVCGCDPDCWCRRTAVAFERMTKDEVREWKREQDLR